MTTRPIAKCDDHASWLKRLVPALDWLAHSYDAAGKQQPAADQVITATAEAPKGKAKLEFEKKGGLLVSKTPLPEGEGYQVVVQAKASADAKPKNFRIKLMTHNCGGCSHPEYACTCDQ